MSEWKTYKLGGLPIQFIDGDRGKNYPKGDDFSEVGHCLFLNAGNVTKNGWNFDGNVYISEEKDNLLRNGKLERGDIVLTTRGTVGNVVLYSDDIPYKHIRINSGMVIIRNNNTCYNPYLYQYLRSYSFLKQVQQFQSGSAQPQIPISTLKKLTISLPPLAEQKRIADILSAIDDKIELNRRINANLEQQAQALYKSWFVDFEFPNEEGKPYKSSGGKMQESELGLIPKGWNIDKLGNKVVIKRGGSPRPIQDFLALKGLRWLKISDATAEPSPYIYKIKEFIKEEGLSKTVFLNKGELVLSNSATPGLPKLLGLDTCIHDGWLYFPKSDFSKEYLFELFLFEREKILSQANGSVFSNLKTDILKALTIIVPQENVLNRFQNIISQIFRSIQQKQEEIISLTTLRDTLLPKLMSGEITV